MIGNQNYSFDLRDKQNKERYEKIEKIGEGRLLVGINWV
jgi:hypothetical protein